MLEGPASAITPLFEKIATDKRYKGVILMKAAVKGALARRAAMGRQEKFAIESGT